MADEQKPEQSQAQNELSEGDLTDVAGGTGAMASMQAAVEAKTKQAQFSTDLLKGVRDTWPAGR